MNDPLKPFHRSTNGPRVGDPDHWKPLKPMVEQPKHHWKNIEVNGQSTITHSIVMVSSKTIANCNGFSKTIEIFNGLFKFIEIFNDFLNLKWIFVNRYWKMLPVFFLSSWSSWSSSFYLLCCKFTFCHKLNLHNFLAFDFHRDNFKWNHQKNIEADGQLLKKHSMVMV